MVVDTNNLIPMTEANQNFSKVTRMVDEEGMAVILKNNKPKYVVVGFNEYDKISLMRKERQDKINKAADEIIEENIEAFLELAKWYI